MIPYKYPKIETLYERDIEGTKKLIEGKFRNETVEYLKNNQWDWTEKVDGTNIRIYWDGHEVEFGGRTDKAQIPEPLINRLSEIFCTEEAEQVFEQIFGDTSVTLFGEGYGGKIQAAGPLYNKEETDFILFDVRIYDTYMQRDYVEYIAKAFNIQAVPIVGKGTLLEAVNYIKTDPDSTLGNLKMEGIVCRPSVPVKDKLGNPMIVKIKHRDFVQKQ